MLPKDSVANVSQLVTLDREFLTIEATGDYARAKALMTKYVVIRPDVQKVLDKDAAHFDPSQVGVTASRMPTLRSRFKMPPSRMTCHATAPAVSTTDSGRACW